VNDAVVPGWHGKLPSLGDFASRRLPGAFVEPWDDWLAAGLLALREAAPEAWLAAYLGSPSWRFLLMPGALPGEAGVQCWAGVLMPSVDRVGRYFPLTIARALGDGPAHTAQMTALWHWLARLDELARDALYDDWSVERLEDELARMSRHRRQ
jgi:type VI secretion system protein ImpM